ncbi:arsenate reductase ArsC [Listeria goaensis]|nr:MULTISPECIES: arsenate reductase ArsC [Listeria]
MRKIAFICIHNSCRSQMAEGWGKVLLNDIAEIYSAGTENYPEVKPLAVEVMGEAGVDIAEQYPKLLADIPGEIDIVITMGCGVSCPNLPSRYQEDWGLVDPSGSSIDKFRETRDLIQKKVSELRTRILGGEFDK